MEDVLAVYEKPLSEKEPVVCVDEKPVVLHADVRPPRPMRPGRVARRQGCCGRRTRHEVPPSHASPFQEHEFRHWHLTA